MSRVDGVEKPGLGLIGLLYAVVRRKLGRVVRPLKIHALAPSLLRGYAMMESGQEGASAVPGELKKLVQLRVAIRIGCPF